jgi:nitrogen fixation/metabolism regulation signal transduction histidine kinase
VSEDYGMGERVALMPSAEGDLRGAPVSVRGGFFLDAALLGDLGGLMQADVGLRDRTRGAWIAADGSALPAWSGGSPESTRGGEVRLHGASFRWAATALDDALWLVAAESTRETEAAATAIRRAGAAGAGLALVAAVGASLLLSARLSRPVSELAAGARRVAAGDLVASVPVSGPRETVELARAFNDMTAALRDSHARLVQAERVASWREMARRLAHELKNPLFPIQLSVETLRRALDRRDAPAAGGDFERLFRESSDTILEELASLRRIIDDFSRFARMPAPRLGPTDLNDVVERALALYRPQAGTVAVEADLDPALPRVQADAELLARALGNLVKNALEAMPGGGRLALRTRVRDGGVGVEVEDSGPGLTGEQRTRLFTPYYTTKPGGTGLGLAIVQGVVSDHGGRIDVWSEPGAGTRFTIVLPTGESAGLT